MRFLAIILIAVLTIFPHGSSPTGRPLINTVPYGMAEFGPLSGKDLTEVMPRSRKLSQMERLTWSEKCKPFRRRCSMAEHCCSLKCLVHMKRCNA